MRIRQILDKLGPSPLGAGNILQNIVERLSPAIITEYTLIYPITILLDTPTKGFTIQINLVTANMAVDTWEIQLHVQIMRTPIRMVMPAGSVTGRL